MGYAHGITKEEVFETATAIFARGKNPTQATVRAALGKGSFSTISKHLAEWREQQTDAEALVTSTEQMPDQVQSLLHRTYAAIRAHAESTVVGEQTTLLEQENERLREKLTDCETTKAELAGLQFAYREAIARMEQLTRENERIAKNLPQIDQVEELLGKVSQLETENLTMQRQLEELEIKEAQLQDQVLTSQRNLTTAIDRANEMEQELHNLTAANGKLNTDLSKVGDRNLELVDRLQTTETALAEKLAEIEELKNELKVSKEAPTRKSRSRKLKGDQLSVPLE